MSEAFRNSVFLTLSGGFQDAYTYIGRGKVFANAQTGNIVLLATNLCEGNFERVGHYLVPLLAFVAGVLFAEAIHERFHRMEKLHWRQLVLAIEILLLVAVGFVPQSMNLLANALVSFVCAMQVQTFRKVRGHAYASTMCIGNMRSGTEALCAYFHTRDIAILHKALTYFGVIVLFALGAGFGALLTNVFSVRAIWFSCALLTISFFMMFIKETEAK